MINFLAIDIGSGLTKFTDGIKHEYFPSIVGKHNNNQEFGLGIEEHEIINVDNERWLVGETAKHYIEPGKLQVTTKSSWHKDPGQIILMYSAIAKLYPDGLTGNVALVSGLPTSRFAEKQKETINNLKGEHQFSTPNAHYQFTINDDHIAVLPQSIGLHFSNLIVNKNENWNDINVGYIDGGTFTTGYALIEEGKFNNLLSGGADIGMSKLAKALKPVIERKYNIDNLSVTQVMKWLRKGTGINFNMGVKEDIDMLDLARNVVPQVYEKIMDEIMQSWGGASSMYVILSSGGGEYLYEYVKRKIPHARMLHTKKQTRKNEAINANNIYDVVDGYAVYGKQKFQLVNDNNSQTKRVS